jgi:hypothetical protein
MQFSDHPPFRVHHAGRRSLGGTGGQIGQFLLERQFDRWNFFQAARTDLQISGAFFDASKWGASTTFTAPAQADWPSLRRSPEGRRRLKQSLGADWFW